MNYLNYLIAATVSVLVLAGCHFRPDNKSSVRFEMPPHPDVSLKALNQNVSASSVNFCYFANVLGTGISETPYSCAPRIGTNTGFVAPRSSVELEIIKGTGRVVEVYGYMTQAGETCSALPADLSGVPLNRVFRMGRVEGVDTSADTTTVTLTITFPGVNQHYGLQAGLDSSCYANLPPINDPGGTMDSPVQKGNLYTIKSRVSSGGSGPAVATGSNYQVLGGVAHVAQ